MIQIKALSSALNQFIYIFNFYVQWTFLFAQIDDPWHLAISFSIEHHYEPLGSWNDSFLFSHDMWRVLLNKTS